ncbi:hypothetical protein [Lacrimispora sp. JR3]|uniref:hypothetical protein n=1 Tax=Lacrimispora sinapis TaxID=3111456 RepID=UPI003748ACCD
MEDYNFNEKEEYRLYKKIGKKGVYKNYTEWEKSILNKYVNISDTRYIINFKAYLNKKRFQLEHRRDSLVQVLIPFLALIITLALTLPSVLEGIIQRNDNLQSDITSTYLENIETNKVTTSERVDIYKEQIKKLDSDNKSIIDAIIICYIVITFSGVAYYIIFMGILRKITFYKDYSKVLKKTGSKKS